MNAAHTFSDSCLVPLPRQLLVSASTIFFLLISSPRFHPAFPPRRSSAPREAKGGLARGSSSFARLREKSFARSILGNKMDMIACAIARTRCWLPPEMSPPSFFLSALGTAAVRNHGALSRNGRSGTVIWSHFVTRKETPVSL